MDKCTAWMLAALLLPGLGAAAGMQPVPHVQPQRLQGTWYELARLPANTDPPCARDATAHYEALPDGSLSITHSCRTASGKLETDVGRAWPLGGTHNAARMRVSFMPKGLRWLPLRRSEWWVVMLDPGNRIAAMSEPQGRHLRVLARTPAVPAEQLRLIVDRLAAQGYPTRKLVLSKQSAVLEEIPRPRLIVRQAAVDHDA